VSIAEKLLSQLNDEQQQGVVDQFGSHMIIAGAGSGKTRVITTRIAYLMAVHNVPAYTIVALTFTNKAGSEMKERIASYTQSNQKPFVGTFHAYCVQLLRRYKKHLPHESFTIIDSDDQRGILRKIIKRHNLEKHVTPQQLQGMISFEKNHLPGTMQERDVKPAPFFAEVFQTYEKEKEAGALFDFDDLLIKVLALFEKNKIVKQDHQARVRHVLVDEYQDTNQVQHALLKHITQQNDELAVDSVCIVGDGDQSIYSWRGAQADNMNRFAKDFAPVNQVKIEQNYRSVKPILDAANAVIAHNEDRLDKSLWSTKEARNRIVQVRCQSNYQESDFIASTIRTILKKSFAHKDIAILYRTHYQSRSLEEALIRANIPYTIIGGIRFYERKEVKDILAYLRLAYNQRDRASLFRIINTPTRGLGDKCEEYIEKTWFDNPNMPITEVLNLLSETTEYRLTQKQRDAYQSLAEIIAGIPEHASLNAAASYVIKQTGYISYLTKSYDPIEAETKKENVYELLNSITHFEQEHPNGEPEQFLEEVSLMPEKIAAEDTADMVPLMTLHTAKGLEFKAVIIAGLEEEILPSSRSMHSAQALEEERRLFYVGMTRAEEYLILTNGELRNSYGNMTQQLPSRFLDEIPNSLLVQLDIRTTHPVLQQQQIADFLGVQLDPSTMIIPTIPQRPRKTFASYQESLPKKKTTSYSSAKSTPWKKNMPVSHPQFGIGIVTDAVKRDGSEYFVTVRFKTGTKKILSRFLQKS